MSLAKSSDINYSTKLDKNDAKFILTLRLVQKNNFHATPSLEVQSRTRTETKSTSEFVHVEYSFF